MDRNKIGGNSIMSMCGEQENLKREIKAKEEELLELNTAIDIYESSTKVLSKEMIEVASQISTMEKDLEEINEYINNLEGLSEKLNESWKNQPSSQGDATRTKSATNSAT